MTEIMIASEMNDDQIDTAVAQLRAAMRKHRKEISKDTAQHVLGTENLGMRMFAVFRGLAEAVSAFIVRLVPVNRDRTPQEALNATGRKQYTDQKVVDAMPRGKGKDAQVIFFKPRPEAFTNGYITDEALEKEYAFLGLTPADSYSLCAVNEADPVFADEHPNATHWKDADGKWCFATFHRWNGGRKVYVNRHDYDWRVDWLFAGLRK